MKLPLVAFNDIYRREPVGFVEVKPDWVSYLIQEGMCGEWRIDPIIADGAIVAWSLSVAEKP